MVDGWLRSLQQRDDRARRRQTRSARRGSGTFDGVEALDDGRVLYTCWNDSSVHVFQNGADRRLIRNLPTPADIGVDTRRGHVAVPLSAAGRVEVWSLGERSGAA
jgi:hypothetical protein